MTSDRYVALVVGQYAVNNAVGSPAYRAATAVVPSLKQWAGEHLLGISFSGSYAKGTAISLGTDVDLFVSVDAIPDSSMKDIYWSLYSFLEGRQLAPVARNVAVGVKCGGVSVDVVPGRNQQSKSPTSRTEREKWGTLDTSGDHTLYRRKTDTWMQTNVEEHIRVVAGSGRTAEIRAMKIWRQRQGLEFPSFYLELTVIEALQGQRSGIGDNVMTVLGYISERLEEARVVDPANSNNVVSEDLTAAEKRGIAGAARKSLAMRRWEHILW